LKKFDTIKEINLILDAEFHHIGVAVSSIEEGLEATYDPIQKVTVAFARINGITVEFIKPEGDNSPAKNYVGKGIYHMCFEVKDIRECIKHAESSGFKCIAPPQPAKAFNEREIAWLINSKFGLIELLQQ
jgi:methylmalonyl-CoA/ethylmalonyl-CoA epimerase